MEPKLWKAVLAALAAVTLNPGDVLLDAGGNDGVTARMLSNRFPNQTILTVEPIHKNVWEINRKMFTTPGMGNVKVLHGGLGEANSFSDYAATLEDRPGRQTGIMAIHARLKRIPTRRIFPIYKVDDLIGSEERLAFAHIDVEGAEPYALRGATNTIARDRPVLTLETFPQTNATQHALLLEMMASLKYACKMVNESCGWNDCRNLLCLP